MHCEHCDNGERQVESRQVVYEGVELRGGPPLATVTASTSRKQFPHNYLRRITVTVPSTIDAAGWLSKYLEGDEGDTDLARAMLQAFAETLMSADASAACGAPYNERSEERTNSRNGYRRRPWDTRAGSIDLAVPKLREGSYFPDWLLAPRRRAEQALVAVIGQAYVEGVSTRRVRWGQLSRNRVNEVHQMPYMSGCGPHSEPGRGGIAAPTHVLDHSLGSQRLVQVVGVCPGHCFEHCICPSGQLDAHAPPLTPPGRRLRRVTSAPTTLATSSTTSAGSSSGWVPWFIGSKGRSPSQMAGPAEQCGATPQPGNLQGALTLGA